MLKAEQYQEYFGGAEKKPWPRGFKSKRRGKKVKSYIYNKKSAEVDVTSPIKIEMQGTWESFVDFYVNSYPGMRIRDWRKKLFT